LAALRALLFTSGMIPQSLCEDNAQGSLSHLA
jgi:hypothetical protein